jgi:hypothetical protein
VYQLFGPLWLLGPVYWIQCVGAGRGNDRILEREFLPLIVGRSKGFFHPIPAIRELPLEIQ